MRTIGLAVIISLLWDAPMLRAADQAAGVKETAVQAPLKVTVKVRMEGPYDADTPLQIVCYFKHKPAGDKTLGAAVVLDKRLAGVIAALRNRSEFVGDELETFLLAPPPNTIKPKLLLLIGLGDEESLSADRMEKVGRTALRAAAMLGVGRIAFAPLIRDQGNSKLSAGDVAGSVLHGAILAYDTERRLAKQGLAKEFVLEEWAQEAGPQYFDETVTAVRNAVKNAEAAIAARSAEPYGSKKE